MAQIARQGGLGQTMGWQDPFAEWRDEQQTFPPVDLSFLDEDEEALPPGLDLSFLDDEELTPAPKVPAPASVVSAPAVTDLTAVPKVTAPASVVTAPAVTAPAPVLAPPAPAPAPARAPSRAGEVTAAMRRDE